MNGLSSSINTAQRPGEEGAVGLYRNPHSPTYVRLQQHTNPQTCSKLSQVPLEGGYLIVPFEVTDHTPILWIRPDACEEQPLPEEACMPARKIQTDLVARRGSYARSFDRVHQRIGRGGLEKVVLSRRLQVHVENGILEAERLFFKACSCSPNCFVALWHTPQTGTWLVATPEPLLNHSHQEWSTVALAGTMPLAADGQHTSWSDKNVEEQAIVARFIRKQLDETALHVRQSDVHTLPAGEIQHLCTDFSFDVRRREDVVRLLQRLHPTPAVCGMPRELARQAILTDEDSPRRYYAGFSGPLFLHGQTHLYVSLRCMEFDDRKALLYAGGGVMPESTEQEEWEETCRKMQSMLQLF